MYVRPLRLGDVAAMARLEAKTYPPSMRAGRRQLDRDLREGEWEDSNLGVGLFDGGALVGIFLVYYEPDCRKLFGYFGIACPGDVAAEECFYVADFVVERAYSRYTLRLLKAAWENAQNYRGLPVLGFSVRGALDRWLARGRAFSRLGYEYTGMRRFDGPGRLGEIFLVRFEYIGQPRSGWIESPGLHVEAIKSEAGWRALEPHWDALLHKTPDWTAFQSFRVQQLWWRHLRNDSRVLIIVVRDGETIRAIAPLRIEAETYLGRPRRLLSLIGEPSEIDRPTILRDGEDPDSVRRIFTHLVENRAQWDALWLYEQPEGGVLLSLAGEIFGPPAMLAGIVAGPPCPWVDTSGSWPAFLASKPKTFRKGLERKRRHLAQAGTVRFAAYTGWPEVGEAFETYLRVEEHSWKVDSRLNVAKTAASLDYHRALVSELGPLGEVQIRVLWLGERPIAASFGLLQKGRFLSLHIAHDEAYKQFSPGVLLTAFELEACYSSPVCTEYEFLGGFLNNKLTWMPRLRETRQFYAYRNDALFRAHYAWHFRIEPALKNTLRRCGALELLRRLKHAVSGTSEGRQSV